MKTKLFLIIAAVLFTGYCSLTSEKAPAPRTEPPPASGKVIPEGGIYQEGIASWYGPNFHGKRTANTEIYDQLKLTAAHQELPFDTLVEVENLDNGKKVTVRINDRGPFIKGRIIDLSQKAAQRIDMLDTGTASVRLRIIKASQVIKAVPGTDRTAATTVTTPAQPKPKPGIKTFEKEEIDEAEIDDANKAVPAQPVAEQKQVQTPPLQTPPPAGTFYLQAGAFSSWKNAGRMVSHIKDVLPGIPFSVKYIDGFYKVISTKTYATREEAEKDKQTLQDNGFDIFIKGS